ncbi:MAG: hypothetical protein MUF49_11810 [Oculatellaceae cyanobacterium Prado106]|jgi:hypothetical protein|nr:hypothetical protein [Oculatellaceae cyanobacterium Prado106]
MKPAQPIADENWIIPLLVILLAGIGLGGGAIALTTVQTTRSLVPFAQTVQSWSSL